MVMNHSSKMTTYLEDRSDNPDTHPDTYPRRRKERQTTPQRAQQPPAQRGQTPTYEGILCIPQ